MGSSKYYEAEVETTKTDAFKRELFSDNGSEIRILIELEDIPEEAKARLIEQVDIFTQCAHDILVEIVGDLL